MPLEMGWGLQPLAATLLVWRVRLRFNALRDGLGIATLRNQAQAQQRAQLRRRIAFGAVIVVLLIAVGLWLFQCP